MGITAEVNLLQEDGKHYIEIVVQPYSVPIYLWGRYYYLSGSVKQELRRTSLNEFLLKLFGLAWDEVTESRSIFDDIDEMAFKAYLVIAKEVDRLRIPKG